MIKARFIAVLMSGTLMSGACIADDTIADSVDEVVTAAHIIAPTSRYAEHWLQQIDDLKFQDNSPLGRVKRIQDLPLLTFAETPGTRFYLGVNSDGLVGLHFTSK